MSPRRRRGGPVPVVTIVIVILVVYFLSRWRYVGYDMRYNRVTGHTEQRVVHGPDHIEWVPMANYRYGKPVR